MDNRATFGLPGSDSVCPVDQEGGGICSVRDRFTSIKSKTGSTVQWQPGVIRTFLLFYLVLSARDTSLNWNAMLTVPPILVLWKWSLPFCSFQCKEITSRRGRLQDGLTYSWNRYFYFSFIFLLRFLNRNFCFNFFSFLPYFLWFKSSLVLIFFIQYEVWLWFQRHCYFITFDYDVSVPENILHRMGRVSKYVSKYVS